MNKISILLTFCIFLIKNMTVNLISFAIIVKFINFVTKSVLNPVQQSVDDLRFWLLFIQFTKLSKKPERIKIALQFTCGRGNMF